MARKFISQAEAYRLKKQVKKLEKDERVRFNRFRNDFPGGVYAVGFSLDLGPLAALDMAVKLDCALVAKRRAGNTLDIYAVPRK